MGTGGENPFLITPPPGLLPAPRQQPDEVAQQTIGGDSATRRISPPREPVVTRPPAGHGIPYVTPPVASAAAVPEVDNDETRLVAIRGGETPSWRLVLPDGSATTVTSAVFVGRNPSRTVGDVEGALLQVADTTKSVSKTHALIEALDGQLWVTDLNSTNGVFVTAENVDDVQATPNERTLVPAGSDIELGGFVVQVEHG